MPRGWHDRYGIGDVPYEDRALYRSIVADRKPYFMTYIYPQLRKKYNTFMRGIETNCAREFQMTLGELMNIPAVDMTEHQLGFIANYKRYKPVGDSMCVMNKICKRFEDEFDSSMSRRRGSGDFDYSIMKNDLEYTSTMYRNVKAICDNFNKRLRNYAAFSEYEKIDAGDISEQIDNMYSDFREQCYKQCSDRKLLTDMVLDMCYRRESTKKFAWCVCGYDIIDTLLHKNDMKMSIPVLDDEGDIEFCGKRFSIKTIVMEDDTNEYCTEGE